MHHIAAILPIPHLLKKLTTNAAVRLRTLPGNSQLLSRLPAVWDPPPPSPSLPTLPTPAAHSAKKPHSNLWHLAALTDAHGERLIAYTLAPWERGNKWGDQLTFDPTVPSSAEGKRAAVASIKSLEAELADNDNVIAVFTDGSRHAASGGKIKSGASYTIFHKGLEVARGQFGLGRKAGVYDAEMLALAAASVRIRALLTE
ncbi:hypothetical protein BV25DRAFT_1774172, partial [Artomyces pyxidatus]